MAETHEKPPAAPDTSVGDRDVDAGALYRFMAGLLAVIALAMAAMWGMSVLFRKELVSSDPPAPVLEEARVRRPPPEPRLEVSPPKDLLELREREDATLTGWGWADKEKGLARIPVARAAEIIAEKGLPLQAPATAAGATLNAAEKVKKGTRTPKTKTETESAK